MDPVETYLKHVYSIRCSGAATDETSYYPALSNLLNAVGACLRPKVRCIINLKNQGAGLPDGGFFTPDQLRRIPGDKVFDQVPARGAIEVKGAEQGLPSVAASDQVERYVGRYRQVLVTNLREFTLVRQEPGHEPKTGESLSLAESEAEFWAMAARPQATSKAHGDRLIEYLKRAMLYSTTLTEPKDLAGFLASYARDAMISVEAADLPALDAIRSALEEALGVKFKDEKGEHFFRSTLVQAIFYGVFSAWVLWDRETPRTDKSTRFDWWTTPRYLHVPMINALYHQISAPDRLRPLGLVHWLDLAGEVLNRVDRNEFFDKFEEGHAVQYFYEPFLEAFDPELRKELGVWYTPPEIVKYMVARVDTVLRNELLVEGGLANPQVYVLDPCCGTGAYLVEVLKRIKQTLEKKGSGALLGQDVKRAAVTRVFGFEILPAPFVIGHLQLGLLLQNLGAPLSDEKDERPAIYLTNALTGWEPPTEEVKKKLEQLAISYPELRQERDAADMVKTDKPILVVLGNPPYNAFAGVSPQEEGGLVEPYKEGLISRWGIKKFNLDDLYVRFFRLAERRIADMSGRGVVSFISNHSWISDPSFVALRQHLLSSFDRFWIENMHGNRKISEYAPDGRTSETIFAVPGFSAGIQQGVAISLWVKGSKHDSEPCIYFRDDIDAAKAVERRAQLMQSLDQPDFNRHYERANPGPDNRFSFRPSSVSAVYRTWPLLTHITRVSPLQGMDEDRAGALIAINREELAQRMRAYLDPTLAWEEFAAHGSGLVRNSAGFEPQKVREKSQRQGAFDPNCICRYLFRPYDVRWCYYTATPGVWKRSRPELWQQAQQANAFVLSRPAGVAQPEGTPLLFATGLLARDAMRGHAVAFPISVHPSSKQASGKGPQAILFSDGAAPPPKSAPNLCPLACGYLAALGVDKPDAEAEASGLIWMHVLAIGYSPAYLMENADGIRQDWPRIPLPDSKDALLASAELGRRVAALLDTENPVPEVTQGTVRPELRVIGTISREEGGSLDTLAGELAVTAGWGHAGQNGVTMPGKGKLVERGYTPSELAAVRDGAGLLGDTALDIYLNSAAYWRNIPKRVWDYTIGGYQVIKKWLSYREHDLLGRSLSIEEAHYVEEMARRIAALVLLEPELDANYERAKSSTYPWPVPGAGPAET